MSEWLQFYHYFFEFPTQNCPGLWQQVHLKYTIAIRGKEKNQSKNLVGYKWKAISEGWLSEVWSLGGRQERKATRPGTILSVLLTETAELKLHNNSEYTLLSPVYLWVFWDSKGLMKATELVTGRFSTQLRINLMAVMSGLFVVVDEGVRVCVCVCVCRSILF